MTEADINTGKTCSKCKVRKSTTEFVKDKNRLDGLFPQCRACSKVRQSARYAANKEVYAEAGRADYEKNKDAYKARAARWATENPEKRKVLTKEYALRNPKKRHEANKKHRLDNPGMYAAHFKKRQQRKRQACPVWANLEVIQAMYVECARTSKETGVKHHVDHYYPLKSDIVCGLHNEYNLRIITAAENLAKANSFPEELK